MHGFINLGNTCYFNSAIQALLHTYPITEYIYNLNYTGKCKFSILYKELIHIYFTTNQSTQFNLKALLDAFITEFPRFRMLEPHDTQDALFCIIDILEKEFTEIKSILYGEKTQITISPIGKNITHAPFSIQTLSSNESHYKISDLIMDSTKWHTLEDYVDDDGNRHNVATTRTIFKNLPRVMIVSFDKKSRVVLEDTLTFNDTHVYELQSCIVHQGVQWGGHYYSMCKYDKKWYAQDDERVHEVSMKNTDGYYVLIYILKYT